MAIDAGDVVWHIGADDKGFKKGIKQASKDAKGLGATITKNSKAIGASFAVAGAAITGVMAKAVSTFATTGDAIQKMAIKTGVSTEALSELGFAAEQSGTDLQTLGKAFKNQADFLEDAKDGLSTSTDAMEKLGLTMDDFAGKSPEEVFMLLGDAIGSIEDPIQRAALANDVFKRSGTALLPLFAEGADGIRKLREEAQMLGISLSQEQADSAAKFTDTLNSLKKSIAGVAIQIGGALVPVLNIIMERVTAVVSTMARWMSENPKLTATIISIVAALGALMLGLAPVFLLLPGIIAVFGAVSASALGTGAAIVAGIVAAFIVLRPVIEKAVGWFKENWEQIKAIFVSHAKAIGNILKAWAVTLGVVLKAVGAVLTGFGKGVADQFGDIVDSADMGSMSFLDIMEFLANQIESVTKEIVKIAEQMSKFLDENWDDIVSGVRFMVRNVIRPLGKMLSFFVRMAKGIARAAKSIINSIKAIGQARSEGGGGGGAGGGGGQSRAKGGMVRGFARGGVVPAGMIRVGELGSELMTIPQGSAARVLSHTDMMKAVSSANSGGIGTFAPVISLNISGGSGDGNFDQLYKKIENKLFPEMAKQLQTAFR